MWTAIYKTIDKSGFDLGLKVTVLYSNGIDNAEKVYDVLPDDLNSGVFKQVIQNQIDILNAKESVKATDLDALVNTDVITEIKIDSSPVMEIKPLI